MRIPYDIPGIVAIFVAGSKRWEIEFVMLKAEGKYACTSNPRCIQTEKLDRMYCSVSLEDHEINTEKAAQEH